MNFFNKLTEGINSMNRNRIIKKQIFHDQSINSDDVAFFEEKNGITPEEYYAKKINSKQYYFKPTWSQSGVDVNIPRCQFRFKSTVYNGEDIERIDFSFEEGQRTETVKTNEVELKSKSRFGMGRAVVGSALLGPAGVLLGCTKKDKIVKNNKNGTSTITIPTIKAKITVTFKGSAILNIPLEESDQDKYEFLYQNANNIIDHLEEIKIAKQNEPRRFEESDGFEKFTIKVIEIEY